MIQESNHARIEELFAPEGNGALSYFYASNKIISNPSAMIDILRDFTDLATLDQQNVLNQIISIFEHVSTNAYVLNCIQNGNVIQMLIDLILHYVDNYLFFNKLLVIFDHILRMSSTDQKLVEKSIKKLIYQFHAEEGKIQSKSLFATINIFKSFFNCKINMDKQPQKMIIFHGGNGLEIRGKKDINWAFSNGLSIYFWLYLQNIKFGPQTSLPRLFTFYSPNNGGLECYLIDNKIYCRTVGSKYNSPKIGSNGICLGQVEPKKWNFIGIQHEGPKRILGRSHLTYHFNDKKSVFNLSPPPISSKQKMKMVLFDKIYCKTSSICILPYYIDNDFAQTLNKNKNSIELIKNPKAFIFQQRQGRLYQRNQLGFCPDPILHRSKYMNFDNIIPLFHIYKFAKQTSHPILNQLLQLFVLFLYKSPSNQVQAHLKNYPHMMSELIKSLPNLSEKFNEQTVNTLLHIKQTITNPELLKQYHGELLWSFIDSNISITSKQMLLEIIKNNFTQNVSYFSNIIGLDQMLNAILKLSTKNNRCCEKHYKILIQRFNKPMISEEKQSFGENQVALEYILKIIQLEVQNEKVNVAQEIYKLCRVLSMKFSPCFTLSFMGVIKRVLNEKLSEKLNSNQSKKIIDYLMSKKIYLIFLHVIQNNFFAQIKAESVKIIFSILLKKASPAEQQEISYRLSNVIWKINELNENENKSPSRHQSPEKIKQPQMVPLQQPPKVMTKKGSTKSNNNVLKIASSFGSQEQQSIGAVSQSSGSKNKASSIFKQVGPQAPLLTNRMKGSKTFSFNFMNQSAIDNQVAQSKVIKSSNTIDVNFEQFADLPTSTKQMQLDFNENQNQVMQQEKTNDNDILQSFKYHKQQQINSNENLQQLKPKKKIKSLGLNIDTEAINKMYNDQGQQIVISQQEQEAEIEKIRKLAKICVAAMKGQKLQPENKQQPESRGFKGKPIVPPSTTSNRVLRARQQIKLQQLKLIDEQSQPQSAVKKPIGNIRAINTSIPSPNFGSRKSKSPTSMNSLNDDNLIVLYNSLMENCITIPSYEIAIPSIMYIFFSWIPQTNLEVKFLFDLSLIIEHDQNKDKIRTLIKMPELYDFLFELTYKALLFQQMNEKRLYTEKLEQLIKKIFSFIFKQEPQSLQKFSFIIDWCQNKSKQYHPKCLFLTSRYIFLLIMDAIEEVLYQTQQNDKLMERNFQFLGIVVTKFCKFLPVQQQTGQEIGVMLDKHDQVIFNQSFQMLPSIAPYFTSMWVDYLICQKYYILFKKFFCTKKYKTDLHSFQVALSSNNVEQMQNIVTSALSSQSLLYNAQAQFFLKNSFIFTLIEIKRLLFIQKINQDPKQCEETAEVIWQTILMIIFVECTKQKNQKNNSQSVTAFLKNCKVFCELNVQKAAVIVRLLRCIKESASSNTINMSGSGIYEGKDLRSSQNSKSVPFTQFLMQSYINENLFKGQNISNFQSFKLNFNEAWISGESFEPKIRSEMHAKLIDKLNQIQTQTPNYYERLFVLIQQETQRGANIQVIIQAFDRQARSKFRKLWKNLRIFGSSWTHPDLKLQNDTLFNKNLFTFQRYQGSKFYKLRICKQMSKYRLRYFLKPILTPEPNISVQNQQIIINKEQIGLAKALLYYNENKILIGSRLLQWLFPKNLQPNNSTVSTAFRELDISMGFKKVRMIRTLTVRHGSLAIINDKLVFINTYYNEPPTHLAIAQYKLKRDKNFYKLWPLEFIKQIFKKRYVNRRRAIEIVFIHGKSVMFEFYENDHEDFIKKLVKLKGSKCPNLVYNKTFDPKKVYQAQGLLKKWCTYQISNFQYLMELNNLAGRSYCDLTQYPVMPWILINFQTKLVMPDEQNFRNLQLPMGALGSQQRTNGFIQRYQNMGQIQQTRFHYGTHYSSPAIIYHFLVRLSPFTEGAILLQSGKFDFADRLFFSMSDSFKNATSQYSDVRQLIPEMYTYPETYLNINKLDLGVMQNQKRVHNVQLPAWSRQNPYLYVTKLRKAFEEINVSKNLNKWIDLIFGFKQRGEEAVKNLNCFVNITYEDSINYEELENEKTVKAIETQVLNFGQTPSQIFTKPHQERASPLTLQISGTICDPNVEPRIYRPSRHAIAQTHKEQKQQFNSLKQPGDSIIHMRWFKDSRLVFMRRNGQMLFYKWHVSQPGSNKVPFQCAIEKQKLIPRISKNSLQNLQFYDGSLRTDSFPIQIFNNGHHIALGGLADGKLLIIDTDTNAVQTYSEHTATISSIKSDLKDNFLITGDITGHVIVWRIINSNRLSFYNQMKDHNGQVTSIFISYDLKCIFTSSTDGSVFGYNIITGRKMKVFYHPKQLPISNIIVSTSPLPVIVMFCNEQSIIYCYSINGQLIQRVHQKQIQHFLSPALIRDTLGFEHVAYGNEHGQIIFRTLPFLDNPSKHIVAKDAAVNRVCLSKSNKFVIVGCSDGELSVITAPDNQNTTK